MSLVCAPPPAPDLRGPFIAQIVTDDRSAHWPCKPGMAVKMRAIGRENRWMVVKKNVKLQLVPGTPVKTGYFGAKFSL